MVCLSSDFDLLSFFLKVMIIGRRLVFFGDFAMIISMPMVRIMRVAKHYFRTVASPTPVRSIVSLVI